MLCAVSVEDGVPPFLQDSGQGWIRRSTPCCLARRSLAVGVRVERGRGKDARDPAAHRTLTRAAVDLDKLGERTITVDCDVIQADGGTRTASITGAYVALYRALSGLVADEVLPELPLKYGVASPA